MLASFKYYQQDQKKYEDHSNFQKISPHLARAAPKTFKQKGFSLTERAEGDLYLRFSFILSVLVPGLLLSSSLSSFRMRILLLLLQ